MRKFTLFIASLFITIGAMASDLVPSTNVETPENLFTITSGNNAKVGANAVDGSAGHFAFFAVDGLDDTYYIYSVDAKQWFDYDLAASYNNQKNFVKMSDTQGNYFKVTKCGTNITYYEIRPYNTTGVAGKYLNYFQGADGSSTLGLWQQNGDDDAGSRYLIEEYIYAEEVEPEALSTEYYYQIVNKAYGRALKDAGANPGVTASTAVSTSDNTQLWAIEITDGKYKLKNRSTNNYLVGTTTASAKWTMSSEGADLYIGVQQKGTTVAPTAYYYISATEITNPSNASRTCAHDANWSNGGVQVVTWDNTADGSQWAFVKTDIEIPATVYTITYNFVYDDKLIAQQVSKAGEGEAYPEINIQAPYGVTPVLEDLAFMSGTVTSDETKTIRLEVTKALPFETAVSANDITTWYLVRMHTNEPGYIGDIAEDKTVNVASGKSSDVANENYIWGFVGDVFSGVKVVNKGTGLQLTSTGSGNVTLTEEGTPFFVAETSETGGNATNGFCLRKNGSNQYVNANYGAAKLSHWGATDAGSTFFLTEYEETDITVSAANWATMYLGYSVYVPEGVNVYTISGVENGYVTKVPVEGVIPANTGVLLENAGTFTFKKAAKNVAGITDNWMNGSVEDTYVQGDAYVLSAPGGVIGFYKAELNKDAEGNDGDTHFLNNAGKAYMVLPATESAAAFYGFEWDGTTGIENVEGQSEGTAIYDLMGRRVENPTRGIYVINGKKVLVK